QGSSPTQQPGSLLSGWIQRIHPGSHLLETDSGELLRFHEAAVGLHPAEQGGSVAAQLGLAPAFYGVGNENVVYERCAVESVRCRENGQVVQMGAVGALLASCREAAQRNTGERLFQLKYRARTGRPGSPLHDSLDFRGGLAIVVDCNSHAVIIVL